MDVLRAIGNTSPTLHQGRLAAYLLIIASALPVPARGESAPATPDRAGGGNVSATRSRWSVFLDRGTASQEGGFAALLHRSDHVGNPLIGTAETTSYRAGIGYQAWSWISFDAAYSFADIRFGADYPFENVDAGKGRLHEYQMTALVHAKGDPFAPGKGWGAYYCAGFITGLGRISRMELLEEGRDSLSIQRLTTRSGVIVGLDMEVMLRIARTGLGIGISAALLGGGAEIGLETDPAGPYESGTGKIAPETFGVRLRYRLP